MAERGQRWGIGEIKKRDSEEEEGRLEQRWGSEKDEGRIKNRIRREEARHVANPAYRQVANQDPA
jgi:hypothetical protein